jgi:hypothetical protein
MNYILSLLSQIKDIHGNPLFTWENLIVWAICAVLIYVSIQAKVFFLHLPSRKRNRKLNSVYKSVRICTYREQLANELHKNKIC